mgnify:CR=1 FL=1|jgi:hypothetical protein
MTKHLPVEPVKLVVAALCSRPDALTRSLEGLRSRRGNLDHQGTARPFNLTDYYEKEMGTGLERRILSFDRLASPDELVDFKHECVELERSLAEDSGRRTVNLDPGYLDHGKLVLASLKAAGQKIYLARGVYADLVGRYGEERYRPFEWTFPDFSAGLYDEELGEIRRRYLEQLRG